MKLPNNLSFFIEIAWICNTVLSLVVAEVPLHAGSQLSEVDLNVVACWQSSFIGDDMLVCLDTCKLLIHVEDPDEDEHLGVLAATAQVRQLGDPAGVSSIMSGSVQFH